MGVGGPPKSIVVVDAGGVWFSLSFIARASSSLACLLRLLKDLGRESKPARLVEDFVFFGFSGEGSRDLSIFEESLIAILESVVKADFVGERPLSLSEPLRLSSRDFRGDRGPATSC